MQTTVLQKDQMAFSLTTEHTKTAKFKFIRTAVKEYEMHVIIQLSAQDENIEENAKEIDDIGECAVFTANEETENTDMQFVVFFLTDPNDIIHAEFKGQIATLGIKGNHG